MTDAFLLEYEVIRTEFSFMGQQDRDRMAPAKAVYLPNERILVQRDPHSAAIRGFPFELHRVMIGEEAERTYGELADRLRHTSYNAPHPIDVSDAFVAWARALHETKNPPKEVSDFLEY
ncbi:hypothetical protein HYU19_03915 [Candidatus Woesearchaeota archaeon]|nr:hypothetical protein [Candidatus Woesearchaeota archaeon]